jgi:hypothetical protein
MGRGQWVRRSSGFERSDGFSIGVIVFDHVDKDYSWVLMGRGPAADKAAGSNKPSTAGFRLIELGMSLPTVDAAADALAMAATEFNVKTQHAAFSKARSGP